MPLWNSDNEDTRVMAVIWKVRISVNCLILDRSITVNRANEGTRTCYRQGHPVLNFYLFFYFC